MEMISGIPFGANLAKSFRTDRTSSRASQHGGSANVMRLVRASAGLITLSPERKSQLLRRLFDVRDPAFAAKVSAVLQHRHRLARRLPSREIDHSGSPPRIVNQK